MPSCKDYNRSERKIIMKDHSKFYNWLRFMAIISIVVGGFSLIILIYDLISSGGSILQDSQLPSSFFYLFPFQSIVLFVFAVVCALSGITFGIFDFLCWLKAVGILAIVKAVSIVGIVLTLWGGYVIYSFQDPFQWIIFAVVAEYFVCGIYSLKCNKDEINNLKLKTE